MICTRSPAHHVIDEERKNTCHEDCYDTNLTLKVVNHSSSRADQEVLGTWVSTSCVASSVVFGCYERQRASGGVVAYCQQFGELVI
jgi:hypothetical protein